MSKRALFLIFLALFGVASAADVRAQQGADNRGSLIPRAVPDDSDQPKSFRETLVKMRIDKEKEKFNEMVDRSEEAVKLSEDLEKAYASAGRLDAAGFSKVASIEKLVKKIRSELGGGDDDGDEQEALPTEHAEVVRTFREKTLALFEELKRSTRFTVSTAAIQTSNAVLKLAKVLKIAK